MQTNPIWIRTSINNQHIMCNGKVYGKFSVGKLCGYSLNYAGWCAKLVWLRLVGRLARTVGLNWRLCACGRAITPLLFYTHYYVTQSILNKCLVANLMCLALHGMIERNRARIRTLLTVSYSEILTEVRRGAKGLRIAYLFSIQIIGDYPEGLRAVDICRLSGKSAPNIAARLKRCVSAGFVRKQGTRRDLRYYLTEQGQQVYNTIVKESDKAIKEITVLLAAEVRKKLE